MFVAKAGRVLWCMGEQFMGLPVVFFSGVTVGPAPMAELG